MSWLRVYNDLLDDRKLSRVARDTGLTLLEVRGAWVSLLLEANQSPIRGCLLLDPKTPLEMADIAETLHVTEEDAKALFEAFRRRDMIADNDAGLPYITAWDKRQYESDSSTDRVQKHRNKVKLYRNVSVTPPDQTRPDQSTDQTIPEGKESGYASADASSPSSHPIQKHKLAMLFRDLYLGGGLIAPISACRKSWDLIAEIDNHPLKNEALGSKEQTEQAFEFIREKRCRNGNKPNLPYALSCILGMMNDKLEARNAN